MKETLRSADTVREGFKNRYEDIISMPHHVSKTRKRMSREDRAAQFSSSQALSGFGDDIDETARLTDIRPEVSEEQRREINEILTGIIQNPHEDVTLEVMYYIADKLKSGGACVSVTGEVKRVGEYERLLYLKNGTEIPIDDILKATKK